jgi:hypothetical protein
MTIRDIRQAPFCWQAKSALRRLRRYYSGDRLKQRATALGIYMVLTEIASDQHRQDRAEAFVAQIVDLTGTSEATVKRYLRDFEERVGLIAVERRKIADTISLANVYQLLTVLDDPPGFTHEPPPVKDRVPPGFTGEPGGPTTEPLNQQTYLQNDQQGGEQQHVAPTLGTNGAESHNVVVMGDLSLVDLLVERGITAKVARLLITQHSPTVIAQQIEHFDWERENTLDDEKMTPGRLRRRIEEDWAPPPGYVAAAERRRQIAEEGARRAEWGAAQFAGRERARQEYAALLAGIGADPGDQETWHILTDNPTRLPRPFREALFRAPRGKTPPVIIFLTAEAQRDAAAAYRAKDRQDLERRLHERFPDYARVALAATMRTRYVTYDEYRSELAPDSCDGGREPEGGENSE